MKLEIKAPYCKRSSMSIFQAERLAFAQVELLLHVEPKLSFKMLANERIILATLGFGLYNTIISPELRRILKMCLNPN